jgi:hypothetical protein
MPSWLVLIVKILVLLVTHFVMYAAGEKQEEIRSRPIREALERLKNRGTPGCKCSPCECVRTKEEEIHSAPQSAPAKPNGEGLTP